MFVGLPPQLTGGQDSREELQAPIALLIEERSDGVFLVRLTSKGEFAGDTWHLSLEDAKEQALNEFGAGEQDWRQLPQGLQDVGDIVSFAVDG